MKRLLITLLLLTLAAPAAYAKMGIGKKFKAAYPNTTISGCVVCHNSEEEPGDSGLNSYGQDLSDNGSNFKAIESKDSDGDGATNLAEINAGTLPGDMSSVP